MDKRLVLVLDSIILAPKKLLRCILLRCITPEVGKLVVSFLVRYFEPPFVVLEPLGLIVSIADYTASVIMDTYLSF